MNDGIVGDKISEIEQNMLADPSVWLITGIAGFIGYNLASRLIDLGQAVIGVDNLSTGRRQNVELLEMHARSKKVDFEFILADIRDSESYKYAFEHSDFVLHQAALGSVPRSLENPLETSAVNILGFQNVLELSRQYGISRLVYASSSSVYGNINAKIKREGTEGQPMSPYALSKKVDEQIAQSYAQSFDFPTVGLRYFNVFGPRQSPEGPYAAVIPKWIEKILSESDIEINGDGSTTRDFCYVDNVVNANLLAAHSKFPGASVFNVGQGTPLSLLELKDHLAQIALRQFGKKCGTAIHRPFRAGDVLHSNADLTLVSEALGYSPRRDFQAQLAKTVENLAVVMNGHFN